jgi:hypothetical protein
MLKPRRTKPIFALYSLHECVAMKREVLNSEKGNGIHASIDIRSMLYKLNPLTPKDL